MGQLYSYPPAPVPENRPKVVQLPPERKGESHVLRNSVTPDLVSYLDESIRTLHDSFKNSVKRFPTKDCLGKKVENGYEWISYQQTYDKARVLGSGLVNLGTTNINHQGKDMVGMCSINRLEYFLVGEACNMFSFAVVPLYDTLGPTASSYIINQTEISVVFCDPTKVKNLLKHAKNTPSIRTVVQWDSVSSENSQLAKEVGVKLIPFSSLEESGSSNMKDIVPPTHETLNMICYTSGTTGDPKGVQLTHGNLIAGMAGLFLNGLEVNENDIHLSYLPMAHIMEKMVTIVMFSVGGAIGVFGGDIKKVTEDLKVLKPTIFPSVPRLFNKIFDKVMAKLRNESVYKQYIFNYCLSGKKQGLKQGYYTHAMYDSVLRGIPQLLGGRVRLMFTGSAPISGTVLDFLRGCCACPVLEGYGQTESGACVAITSKYDTDCGHVGIPVPCCELKLVDVPEMDYLTTDKPFPRGEICFRGPCCSKGYFKKPEKTAELIDEHGWMHSGDIGLIRENGYLQIIDRKKNIFKLSIGEYVAPEKIENIYKQSPFVAQAFVYGESLKATIVAVLVPDIEVLAPWAEDKGLDTNLSSLCKIPEVKEMIFNSILEKGKSAKLRSFEQVKRIYLHDNLFTIENGIITPTFKLKRPQAKEMFKSQLDSLYEGLE